MKSGGGTLAVAGGATTERDSRSEVALSDESEVSSASSRNAMHRQRGGLLIVSSPPRLRLKVFMQEEEDQITLGKFKFKWFLFCAEHSPIFRRARHL